jgi:DNA-directed RNA polymerase subunit E'/Rpb7
MRPVLCLNLQVIIKEGSHIRVRLIGIRMEDKTIFAVGTILDDYLGPLDNAV